MKGLAHAPPKGEARRMLIPSSDYPKNGYAGGAKALTSLTRGVSQSRIFRSHWQLKATGLLREEEAELTAI
jgi:hypothetical protein